MEPLLEVKKLTVPIQLKEGAYLAVDDVSFSLSKGKTLALVGESGCGKTMTALSLLNLLQPPVMAPEGEVLFHGENLLKMGTRALRKIRGSKASMIFQDPSSALNPVFSIGNQLMEALFAHLAIGEEEAYALCLQALREVGIPDPERRMEEYPHEFSGGMKQRVMIAMAILCRPELLIADEPTTALDVTIQAQVLDLLRNLKEKESMALLLITHDLGVVAEMADDVAVMYAGRIVESGSVDQIFEAPSHPYTQALFKAYSRKRNDKGELQAIPGSVPSLKEIPKGCPFHPRCPHAFSPCYQGRVPDFEIAKMPRHQAACWLRKQDG